MTNHWLISSLVVLGNLFIGIFGQNADESGTFDMLMPGVKPESDELYLCTAFEMPQDQTVYITGYSPQSSAMVAHHMLIYGCELPGSESEEVWNCGEMSAGRGDEGAAGPCGAGGASQIIYGWAKDAPALTLPEGVAFQVGGNTPKQYLVLQVHYMHKMDTVDHSGITLHITPTPQPKEAGVLLLGTGGNIPANSHTRMDTACNINEPVEMHPFAFRTHTHKLGTRVSGYVVRNAESADGGTSWDLIGTHNPQEPQMFYPITTAAKDAVIGQGDVVAAECCMRNNLTHAVGVGATGEDEMCNFYMMYWVDGGSTPLQDNMCFSPGPPHYTWANAGLENAPEDKC